MFCTLGFVLLNYFENIVGGGLEFIVELMVGLFHHLPENDQGEYQADQYAGTGNPETYLVRIFIDSYS